MIRHVVVYRGEKALVDRQTLAALTGRSVHTIRARCSIVGHKDGKALYDAEESEARLAKHPPRHRGPSGPRGQGFVYFARLGNRVKIGFTTSVERRMRELRPAVLMAAFPGTHTDEWRAHAAFAHLRIEGEWFRAEPDLIDFVTRADAA